MSRCPLGGCSFDKYDSFRSWKLPFHAGISGRIWGTFLPSEAAPSEDKAPRGVSILARDLQSVVFYDSKGTFMGVRRPDSGKPIEVCC